MFIGLTSCFRSSIVHQEEKNPTQPKVRQTIVYPSKIHSNCRCLHTITHFIFLQLFFFKQLTKLQFSDEAINCPTVLVCSIQLSHTMLNNPFSNNRPCDGHLSQGGSYFVYNSNVPAIMPSKGIYTNCVQIALHID